MNEVKGEAYRKYGFWAFCSENPIMVIITLVILLGLVAILMGYREGFASVLTGLFGFMKKDDTDRKLEMKELEVQKAEAENRLTEYALSGMMAEHDKEVEENVQSAKAYIDEVDMDELGVLIWTRNCWRSLTRWDVPPRCRRRSPRIRITFRRTRRRCRGRCPRL